MVLYFPGGHDVSRDTEEQHDMGLQAKELLENLRSKIGSNTRVSASGTGISELTIWLGAATSNRVLAWTLRMLRVGVRS